MVKRSQVLFAKVPPTDTNAFTAEWVSTDVRCVEVFLCRIRLPIQHFSPPLCALLVHSFISQELDTLHRLVKTETSALIVTPLATR